MISFGSWVRLPLLGLSCLCAAENADTTGNCLLQADLQGHASASLVHFDISERSEDFQ